MAFSLHSIAFIVSILCGSREGRREDSLICIAQFYQYIGHLVDRREHVDPAMSLYSKDLTIEQHVARILSVFGPGLTHPGRWLTSQEGSANRYLVAFGT